MIKKIFGLLIFCFGLINITFGYAYINEIGLSVSSNGTNLVYVDGDLNFVSMLSNSETEYNYFGYMNVSTMVMGRKGNRLYSYDYYSTINKTVQGYINKIYKCTYNTVESNNRLTLNDNITHCSEIGNIDTLENYLPHINYYAFGRMGMGSGKGNATTLCFIEEDPTEISSSHERYCLYPDMSDSEDYNWKNYTIDTIQGLNLFNSSPLNGGNNNGLIQQIRTGQNYYCPTFRQLLSTYPTNYDTGLCYNGTLKYENGQLTTVQKQDIFTVFTDYEEYQQYVYLYNNYCTGPATQTACENAFNGEREKYSIISNAYNKNVDDKKIWQYCDMAINYDLNTTTCTAGTGTLENIGQAPTPENITDLIEQLSHIGNVQTPITGNILNNLLEDGQTREDISPRNIIGNLDQIKDKLSNLFEERTGTNGIIPDYIMWLILVSLLLTVLLKK